MLNWVLGYWVSCERFVCWTSYLIFELKLIWLRTLNVVRTKTLWFTNDCLTYVNFILITVSAINLPCEHFWNWSSCLLSSFAMAKLDNIHKKWIIVEVSYSASFLFQVIWWIAGYCSHLFVFIWYLILICADGF